MHEQAVPVETFLVRSRGGATGWQVFAPVNVDIDVDVRALTLGAPELLGPFGRSQFRAAMPAPAAPDRPGQVLVAVEEVGTVAIVACPDSEGPEARQHLVADILWAQAMLWHRSYDGLSADFRNSVGTALEQLVGEKAGPDWSAEHFRSAVRANLDRGRFPVILVTVKPGPAQQDVAGYLRSLALAVTTVNLGTYRSGETEAVMPGRADDRAVAAARPAPGPARPVETRPEPPRAQPVQKPPPQPATPRMAEESDKAENPWSHVGTRPGVMAGKRPPDTGRQESGGSGSGKK